jgi:hypothetical protein
MDTTQNQKRKKSESWRGSEKPSQDKQTRQKSNLDSETITVRGEKVTLPPDIKNLQEFDWDDPKNKKWIKEQDKKTVERYGRLSTEQMESIYKAKLRLLSQSPALDEKRAFDLAWEHVTGKKLPAEA